MIQGLPWWGWAVAAGLVAVAELHAPGGYLVWVALGGALTAAMVAGFDVAALTSQIGGFAGFAAASCVLGWFVYRRLPARDRPTTLNRRALALVGARATVCDDFVNGQGKVRLGDGSWLAEGPPLGAGALVIVTDVRGARLVVRAAE
jgi:membrane protein implicated in regulation of membrane protease activity